MSLKIEDRNDERSVSEFSHFFRYSMVTSLSQKIADLRSNGRIPLLLSTTVRKSAPLNLSPQIPL